MVDLPPDWMISLECIFPGFDRPRCHATTLAETDAGLVLAFFGGEQTDPQSLYVMRKSALGWSPTQLVVASTDVMSACWNPVLHQVPDGPLLLFFQQGPTPAEWQGRLLRSHDQGATWSQPETLPDEVWGPIRNKPVRLGNGILLCGSSRERGGWCVHFDRTSDDGRTWLPRATVGGPALNGAIQPTIIPWSENRIQALCRTREGLVMETWSYDGGATWSALEPTTLPNPNSAIDAVLLDDGRGLLVYNPTDKRPDHEQGPRTPIALALSSDGLDWNPVATIEHDEGPDAEFSYPAVIQTADGLVHVTYTTDRRWTGIRHVVIDPRRLG